MDDNEALVIISQLQDWAQKKFGEREFKYYRVTHRWSQSKGRPRNDGAYYTSSGSRYEISQEEYEAGLAAGKREELKAFMGKRKGGWFDTCERKQVKDGWQDVLAKTVVEETK